MEYSIESGKRPVHAWASSLEFHEKAVSFFMPDNTPFWYNSHRNSIKHSSHRKFFAGNTRIDVRSEGADPKTKLTLTIVEFDKEMEMICALGVEKDDNYDYTVKYPAIPLWQYHLIGQIDDVVHVGRGRPMGNTVLQVFNYDQSLMVKERDG